MSKKKQEIERAKKRIIKLTVKQREKLIQSEKMEDKPQVLKRIQSILLRDKGWTQQAIAEHLAVGRSVIGKWTETYLDTGLKGLLFWGYCGKRSKLTPQQIEKVKIRIREKPFATAQEAVDYITDNFQIKYHSHYMPRLLKKIVYPTRNPA